MRRTLRQNGASSNRPSRTPSRGSLRTSEKALDGTGRFAADVVVEKLMGFSATDVTDQTPSRRHHRAALCMQALQRALPPPATPGIVGGIAATVVETPFRLRIGSFVAPETSTAPGLIEAEVDGFHRYRPERLRLAWPLRDRLMKARRQGREHGIAARAAR